MNTTRLRCFIAVEIPENVKEKVLGIQKILESTNAQLKLVEKKNLHITLAFLTQENNSSIESEKIPQITSELEKISSKQKTFDMGFGGIKLIPNQDYVRVIAIDVFNKGNIDKIQDMIKKSLLLIGVKSLVNPAHLTIARVKGPKNKELLVKKADGIKISLPVIKTNSFVLFKSTLTPQGPVYEKIKEFYFIS